MMKSLHRKSKKCDTDARLAKTKSKNSYKNGDIDSARIFAETSVRKHKESQHYQMLSARLSPILAQLKDDFAGRSSLQNCQELQQLLQEVITLGDQENFDVFQNEINTLMQDLNNDQSFDATHQPPTSKIIDDLEQRLANLRKRTP